MSTENTKSAPAHEVLRKTSIILFDQGEHKAANSIRNMFFSFATAAMGSKDTVEECCEKYLAWLQSPGKEIGWSEISRAIQLAKLQLNA